MHEAVSKIKKAINNKEKKIGWEVAPLLNTPGRFGNSQLTANFFIESDMEKLYSTISKIRTMNSDRKNLVQEINTKLIDILAEENDKNLIYILSDEIPQGLTGLIANRITDNCGKPVIIASSAGKDDFVKGSARCRGDFNFFCHAEKFSHLFERLGGHNQAFGFTATIDKLEKIIDLMRESIGESYNVEKSLIIDLEVDLNIITSDFIDCLSILEPFGKDNEEPMFITRNIEVHEFLSFGSDSAHGKFLFNENVKLTAIGWSMAKIMKSYFVSGKKIDIVYNLENNVYRGTKSPRMMIVDIDFSHD
ncbi:DHHA1 domain-containing protein [Spirochaetota bacterium]